LHLSGPITMLILHIPPFSFLPKDLHSSYSSSSSKV
jgi:hypothetical protein